MGYSRLWLLTPGCSLVLQLILSSLSVCVRPRATLPHMASFPLPIVGCTIKHHLSSSTSYPVMAAHLNEPHFREALSYPRTSA
ncbi:hypothetical protein B0O80DRAFT_303786 [Mortierella sp. GBAus27b]|nr:hypothetical protein B0O80DRAFT_303786 [Mortierella sp. GBAus27b]